MSLVPPLIEEPKAGDVGNWSPLIYAVLKLVVAGPIALAPVGRTAWLAELNVAAGSNPVRRPTTQQADGRPVGALPCRVNGSAAEKVLQELSMWREPRPFARTGSARPSWRRPES